MFTGQINLTYDLCTVNYLDLLTFNLANYDLHCKKFVWAIARKSYMLTTSYFQGRSACALQ